MAGASLTLDDLQSWLAARAAAVAGADFSKPLKTVRLLVIADIKSNFAGSHAPDGTPWAPLKWRAGQPLRDTGLLMASVTGTGANSISEVTSRGLRIGSSLDYAAIQNYGGTIAFPARSREKPWVFKAADGRSVFTRKIAAHSVTIPARTFLGISTRAQGQIGGVLNRFVDGLMTQGT